MSNIFKYKGYTTEVKFDSEELIIYGKIEGITDLVDFYSDKLSDVEEEFHKAVDDYLYFCSEHNKIPETPFKGNFNVRVPSEIHREAFIKAKEENKSLNQFVKEAIEEKINGSSILPLNIKHDVQLTIETKQNATPYYFEFTEPTKERIDNYVRNFTA
jgi:predicted HicB family RNase H-like nuclease